MPKKEDPPGSGTTGEEADDLNDGGNQGDKRESSGSHHLCTCAGERSRGIDGNILPGDIAAAVSVLPTFKDQVRPDGRRQPDRTPGDGGDPNTMLVAIGEPVASAVDTPETTAVLQPCTEKPVPPAMTDGASSQTIVRKHLIWAGTVFGIVVAVVVAVAVILSNENNGSHATLSSAPSVQPTTMTPATMQPTLSPLPPEVWVPVPGTTWQWQLQGPIDTSFDVDMYDIDLFDAPQLVIDELHADDRIVICYFSAGTYEDFREDAADFAPELLGNTPDGFEEEFWLDIRDLVLLRPIVQNRLDLAMSKKCDGVQPDNLDGCNNDSGFPLTASDQLAYNQWLASEAHERSLSIGLTNDLEQVLDLFNDFDWALNSQCYQYNECSTLLPFIGAGKAVFGVEYQGDAAVFCPELNALQFSWLQKDEDLFALPRIDCMEFS